LVTSFLLWPLRKASRAFSLIFTGYAMPLFYLILICL
jgi:hypothetical protein